MLFKELIINNMYKKNYIVNHLHAQKLERLDISGSFALGLDQSLAIKGFQ
jgi:hypothetical protein